MVLVLLLAAAAAAVAWELVRETVLRALGLDGLLGGPSGGRGASPRGASAGLTSSSSSSSGGGGLASASAAAAAAAAGGDGGSSGVTGVRVPSAAEDAAQARRDAYIAEHRGRYDGLGHIAEEDTVAEPFLPVLPVEGADSEAVVRWSRGWYESMRRRRSVRHFDPARSVPLAAIQHIVAAAGTAPSGANCCPWHFAVLSNADTKRRIRELIEAEERVNYERRMGDKWVADLRALATNWEKPYLEEAPYLICVFKQTVAADGQPHYYYDISTAIATGFLVTAIHQAGLHTVVTTPMNAGGEIRELLGRESREKLLVLIPVGFPAKDAKIPNLIKKDLSDTMTLYA